MPTKDVTLAEAVVAPGSRLIGRTIEQAAIHHDTGTIVLGVERRSRMPRMALSDIRLEAGDVLLVGGTREAIEGLRAQPRPPAPRMVGRRPPPAPLRQAGRWSSSR